MTSPRTGAGAGRAGLVHAALVHASDEDLAAAVVPFLRDGVAAGEPTVLEVDAARRQVLLDALGDASGVTVLDRDHDVSPYTALREVVARFRGLLAGGAAQARIVGAMPGDRAGWHGWSRYEAALNHLARDLPVWGVCLYDRATTPDEVLADVEGTHTHLASPGGGHEPNPRFQDPADFVARKGAIDVDPIERTPPAVELTDPPAAAARHAVAALALAAGLDADCRSGLGLAVTEAVVNAWRHGRPPVTVRAWLGQDRVAVAVHDEGPGPDDAFAGMVPRAGAGPGGLGLHIAHQVCREVTLERGAGGFTVHLVARPG